MTESDILHEVGDFWVASCRLAYTVFRNEVTHAVSVSSFPKSDDGLSLAMAYCSYRGNIEIASNRIASALQEPRE